MNEDVAALIQLLSDECGWPIDPEMVNRSAWKLNHDELGLNDEVDIGVEVYELRPLVTKQPWGVFFLSVDGKSRLSVTLLRRLLRGLVKKKRATAEAASRKLWDLDDLMFVCSLDEPDNITRYFAHFKETEKGLPKLMIGARWEDVQDDSEIQKEVQKLRKHLHWPDDDTNIEAWRKQWSGGFQVGHREVIKTSATLSRALARFAKDIKQNIPEIHRIEREDGPLHRLHEAFSETLIKDLKLSAFADMVAQTIAYGLFSARATGTKLSSIESLSECMPSTNPFLRDLFSEFASLSGDEPADLDFDDLSLDELVEMLNEVNIDAIMDDFGTQFKEGKEDPVIHFYETFLKEYDNELKFRRGVFYTPKSVVSNIVRSVDEQLRSEFGLKDGLADITTWGEMSKQNPKIIIPNGASSNDPFVNILDPATGTGTFLVEVIFLIHKTMKKKWESKTNNETKKLWNDYVSRHLLQRLHGYELMMAPYSVAHLKVGLALSQTGYELSEKQRLKIFLTNSLDPPVTLANWVPNFLSLEHQAVNNIKQNTRFTVVIGNPPYSVSSENKSAWINELMQPYKDGLNEKNINPLSDDYIKFIRLSQYILHNSGYGLIGFITNNSFFDGLIHRRMRQNIISSFNKICIFNLHGSSMRPNTSPQRNDDENVFDITIGVGIFFLIRKFDYVVEISKSNPQYFELYGNRSRKTELLFEKTIFSTPMVIISPKKPNFFFVPGDIEFDDEYSTFPSVLQLFANYSSGIKTHRDNLVIGFDSKELGDRMKDFFNQTIPDKEITTRINLKEKAEWLSKSRSSIFDPDLIKNISYRPLDQRKVYYHTGVIDRDRISLMENMYLIANKGLIVTRQLSSDGFSHALVTKDLIDGNTISLQTREYNYLFPLYIVKKSSKGTTNKSLSNIREGIINSINLHLGFTSEYAICDIENLFSYIYAVLYSQNYRTRYTNQLKIDYPRIPITSNEKLFDKLAKLGNDLVNLHLLDFENEFEKVELVGAAPYQVDKISYSNNTVWINSDMTKGFFDVNENVWNFAIGRFQPCHKWLKDRQARGGKNPKSGRILNQKEIHHYQKIIYSIQRSIKIMTDIDDEINKFGGWPLEGSDEFELPPDRESGQMGLGDF